MFLVDMNIWLERMLEQEKSDEDNAIVCFAKKQFKISHTG